MGPATPHLQAMRRVALAACTAAAAQAPAQTVTATAELAFGRFAASTGGTISIRADGARTSSGGVVLLASSPSAASFSVDSPTNQQLIISLPPDGSAALTSGAARMPVNAFVSNRPNGLLTDTRQPFTVGATLQVAPNQPGGTYSGAFHVTVEYQ